jgi:Ca2+-transporting ATPase
VQHGSEGLLKVDVIARAVPGAETAARSSTASGRADRRCDGRRGERRSLQAADIGIAMGERGTRSAREVGAIVLLDDNFRTIVSAIREGQQLFRNLRSSFAYLLMIHIPLVATATLIPLAGYPLLYLPIHIVWLELIIHPTALLAFQELNTNARLKPIRERERTGKFFSTRQWIVVVAVGAAPTLVVLIPLLAELLHVEPLHLDDWVVATAGGLVPSIVASLFNGRRWNLARTRDA